MSPAGWLERVGRMAPSEIVFRARTAARTRVQYISTAWRSPGWDREALAPLLVPSAGAIDSALERLDARDWLGAHEALAEHFHRRVSGFPVSPHALPELADRIRRRFPHAAQEAAERADAIAARRFDLLGYAGLDFSTPAGDIDWHYDPVHGRHAPRTWWSRVPFLDPAIGDHKIIWELNRHQHFLALGRAAWLTGREEYRAAFVRQFEDWLHANPPLAGINWASMLELAFRSLSWVWALHLFVEPPGPRHPAGARPAMVGRAVLPEAAGLGAFGERALPLAGERALPRRDGRPQEEKPWLVDMLIALERQLSHVHENLSLYFSPNTHLTGEALALYVCGRALPELRPAAEWADTGRDILLAEIDRQVLPDGGHVERSTHYQRYTLDFYLLALAMARVTEDPSADRFAEAVERLALATRLYADENGRIPLIGDDDGGVLFPICGRPADDLRDSFGFAAALLGRPELAVGATPEETMWLLGNQPAWIIERKADRPTAARHAAFRPGTSEGAEGDGPARRSPDEGFSPSGFMPDAGYFVSRPRPCDHLVVDAGVHGYLNGGHAHADALSLTASLGGRRLLIDPGTGTYTMSTELRDRFRHSRMHNTLTLDGRSQSVAGGPFRWNTTADARVQRWMINEALDYFEGVHDGYLPVVHRRRLLVVPGGPVIVVDTVFGDEAAHLAEVFWHLDPAWQIDGAEGRALSLRHAGGGHAWLLALGGEMDCFAGDEGGLGWHSPVYGRVEPSLTLRLATEGLAPFAIVSVFGEGRVVDAPSIRRLPAETDVAGADVVALEVASGSARDLVVFGYREPRLPQRQARRRGRGVVPGFPAPADRRTVVRAGGLETDARLLCVHFPGGGEPPQVVIADDGSVTL